MKIKKPRCPYCQKLQKNIEEHTCDPKLKLELKSKVRNAIFDLDDARDMYGIGPELNSIKGKITDMIW